MYEPPNPYETETPGGGWNADGMAPYNRVGGSYVLNV